MRGREKQVALRFIDSDDFCFMENVDEIKCRVAVCVMEVKPC